MTQAALEPTSFDWPHLGGVDHRDDVSLWPDVETTALSGGWGTPSLREGYRCLHRLVLDGSMIASRESPRFLVFVDRETIDVQAQWLAVEAPDAVEIRAALNATKVVDDLAARLALPTGAVLRAAAIPDRTYFHWRENPGVRPRLKTFGRLWELLQCVEDLEAIVPAADRPLWVRGEQVNELLLDGQFSAVRELAFKQFYPPSVDLERPVIGPDMAGTQADALPPRNRELDDKVVVRRARRV